MRPDRAVVDSVALVNDWTMKPTTGRPKYVTVLPAVVAPLIAVMLVAALPSVWTSAFGADAGGMAAATGKPRRIQPSWNVVGRFATLPEFSTFVPLNVITLASQQIEFVGVGGGGENVFGVVVVVSSRSQMFSVTSSHEPAVALKLRWNSFGALPVPTFT